MTDIFNHRENKMNYLEYDKFLSANRLKVNRRLNTILWLCILVGPAIALGIKLQVFSAAKYSICALISAGMLIVAIVHYFMLKKYKDSIPAGMFAFFFMDVLIMIMEFEHIHINLTWFFVPMLSILYTEMGVFLYASVSNFIFMVISVWLISPYNSSINLDYNTVPKYFMNAISGYVIEYILMFVVGYTITKISNIYFGNLLKRHNEIKNHADMLNAQMDILDSMAGIYEYANLLDFHKMTEMSLLDKGYRAQDINLEIHAHSRMNHMIKRKVVEEHLDAFLDFTNMRTIQNRLYKKKIISAEFIDKDNGWFRAQYINVESDENDIPFLVIYTIQNIDEAKRREETLVRISYTDELTGLFNRRSLDEDIKAKDGKAIEEDFAVLCIDLNRLKHANDTKGHAAGDELIKGAADIIRNAIGSSGKVYRTGGDEFTALVHTKDVDKLSDKITQMSKGWSGQIIDELCMSIGYATHKDHPDADISELEKIADMMMYEAKSRYYQENGIDRRGQHKNQTADK
ncbi:MAG: GGDEF domain-containing protein [Butyrivibrio sp.]|nr:GGDEF domain-containing protein [Butyrivibrio sp.]